MSHHCKSRCESWRGMQMIHIRSNPGSATGRAILQEHWLRKNWRMRWICCWWTWKVRLSAWRCRSRARHLLYAVNTRLMATLQFLLVRQWKVQRGQWSSSCSWRNLPPLTMLTWTTRGQSRRTWSDHWNGIWNTRFSGGQSSRATPAWRLIAYVACIALSSQSFHALMLE